MLKTTPNNYTSYFTKPTSPTHRQYLALRMFFADGLTAEQVAKKSGYSVGTVYALVRDFKKSVDNHGDDPFFVENQMGRKQIDHSKEGIEEIVINLRKKHLSVPDIQVALNARDIHLSIYSIEKIITDAGFVRLPRRDKQLRNETRTAIIPKLEAPISCRITSVNDSFSSHLSLP